MCTPFSSVRLPPPPRHPVSPLGERLLLGAASGDAAALPIQWIYCPDVLREYASGSDNAAAPRRRSLAFVGPDDRAALYDDARTPMGRAMSESAALHRPRGMTSYLSVLTVLYLDSLGGSVDESGDPVEPLAFDKRFLETFGPGGTYVGYVDSMSRRKLRLIDEALEKGCPTRDGSADGGSDAAAGSAAGGGGCPFAAGGKDAGAATQDDPPTDGAVKYVQMSTVPAEPHDTVTGRCPFASTATANGNAGAAAAADAVPPPLGQQVTSSSGWVLRPRLYENWKSTGVPGDAQNTALAAAVAAVVVRSRAIAEARKRAEEEEVTDAAEALRAEIDGAASLAGRAVAATHSDRTAAMYVRVAARFLAGLLGGATAREALGAAAGVPRCPRTRERMRAVVEAVNAGRTVAEVTAAFGSECHLEMLVPSALHAAATAASFREGMESTLECGGDACGRCMLVGAALSVIFNDPLTVDGEKDHQWLLAQVDESFTQDLKSRMEVQRS